MVRRLCATALAIVICFGLGFAFGPGGSAADPGLGSSRGAVAHPRGALRVSCPAAHWCAVVDGHGRAFEYAHGAFSKPSDVKVPASELACTSRVFCLAVGAKGRSWQWNGRRWSTAQRIFDGPYESADSVDCVSRRFCMAVDRYGDVSAYDGHTWGRPEAVVADDWLLIRCVSSSFCLGVGFEGHTVIYNGKRWTSGPHLPRGHDLFYNSAACVSTTECFAGTGNGRIVKFNGHRWGPLRKQAGAAYSGLSDLTCLGGRFCLYTHGSHYSRFDGLRWTNQPAVHLQAPTYFNGLGCGTPTFCIAGNEVSPPLRYNGTSWRQVH